MSPTPGRLQLRLVTHSETGLVRKNNQDSGYASPHLLVVADGMGGAAAGDLASAVAVDVIRRIDAPTPTPSMLDALTGALHAANDRIADLVESDPALDGMGTTVTGALFDGTEIGLAHIGDSRAYLFRDGRLERLTHDHSWVQSLVDDGKISEAEAAVHPHRSLLLKVLNGQPANEPDLTRLRVQEGDRLLLCSDGLCGLVEDDDLATALAVPDADEAVRRLVAAAHAGGGIDNITIILADVVTEGGSDGVVVLGAAAEQELPPLAPPVRPGPAGGTGAGGPGPTDASAAPPPPDDEARYNPQPPHRHRGRRRLAGALVALLVVATGLGAAYAWTRSQFFVGAADEHVAIFTGLPDHVVVPLSKVYEVQPLTLAELPPYYADQVRAGIAVTGLDSARQTVAELAEAAKRCTGSVVSRTPSPRPSSSAQPRPSTSAHPRPSGTPAPRPSSSARPRTVSPTPAPSEGPETPAPTSPTASGTTGPGC